MVTCGACGDTSPDGARFCPGCGTQLARPAPVRAVRKLVTVVFCDLVGSTEMGERLDAEAVRQVLDRYFDTLRSALEAHGGTVEKFIGDAVMAVFGVPVAHEDDPLRAVRAAAAMVADVDALNPQLQAGWGIRLQVRIGVNTGEVVAGDAAGNQRLASGDAVNLAARLEAASGPGQVLIGSSTYRLLRHQVQAEPLDPIPVKGKAEPVRPYRLLRVLREDSTQTGRLRAPLVGRDAELAVLQEALATTVDSGSTRRVTVVGDAGVGKSRLLAEFLTRYAGAATVLTGRCLSYGRGITFWPVREMVAAAAAWSDADSATASLLKLVDLLPGEPDAEDIADRVAQLVGLVEPSLSLQTCFLGLRQLLERIARWKPLVLVVDDVHWAEPALLELLDYLTRTTSARLLLVCGTRPAPEDRSVAADRLVLEPLGVQTSAELLHALLGGGVADGLASRVLATAEGNPLFLEQLLAMLIDDGTLLWDPSRGWVAGRPIAAKMLPDSVATLLTARLDRLPLPEQHELEAASVVGRVFWRGAVAEIATEAVGSEAGRHLEMLLTRQLIQRDRPSDVADDAYRFSHILIRDATYLRMPKADRATAHRRFATWLTAVVGERVGEYQEIIGYHLEQAYRLRAAIGVPGADDAALALRAGRTLAVAGRRAWVRGDVNATVNLLGRAADLLHGDAESEIDALITLGRAAYLTGSMEPSQRSLDAAIARAGALCDRRRLMRARVALAELWRSSAPEKAYGPEIRRIGDEAIAVLSSVGDDAGLAEAWQLIGLLESDNGQSAEGTRSLQKALHFARRTGDPTLVRDPMFWYAQNLRYGPTPVEEGIEHIEEMLSQAPADPYVQAVLLHIKAAMAAMAGDVGTGRPLFTSSRSMLQDLGMGLLVGGSSQMFRDIVLREGDLAAAEAMLREDEQSLAEQGEEGIRSTTAVMLADVLIEGGRLEEGERFLQAAESITAADDLLSVVMCASTRGKLLGLRGDAEAALDHAREAVRRAEASDWLQLLGEALLTLGSVEQRVGDPSRGDDALRRAVAVLNRKGDTALAALAAARLSQV